MGNLRGSTKGTSTAAAHFINYIKGSAAGVGGAHVSFKGAFKAVAYRNGNFYTGYDFGSFGAFEAGAFNPIDQGGTLSAHVTATGRLAASITGTSTASAHVQGRYFIHASATGSSTAQVTLKGNGKVAGSTAGTETVHCFATALNKIVPHATGTCTVHCFATAWNKVVPTATGHATVTGTVKGNGKVTGSAAGHVTISLVMKGTARLVGSAAGHTAQSCHLVGAGYMHPFALGTCMVHMTMDIPPLYLTTKIQSFGDVQSSTISLGNKVVSSANVLGAIGPVTVRPRQ